MRWTNFQCNQQVECLIWSSVSHACSPIFVCLSLPLCEYQWALSCYHQSLRWQHLSDVSLICLSSLLETGCVFLLGKWNVKCRFKVVMAQQYPGLFQVKMNGLPPVSNLFVCAMEFYSCTDKNWWRWCLFAGPTDKLKYNPSNCFWSKK